MEIDLKQRQLVIETLRQLLAQAEAGDVDGFFAVIYGPVGMNVVLRPDLLNIKEALLIVGAMEQAKFDLMRAKQEEEQGSAT